MGLDGLEMTTSDATMRSQSWFGFYNALAVRYNFDSQFFVTLQAASRFGKTTEDSMFRNPIDSNVVKVERTSLNISAAALASYQFNMNVLIEAGLSMRLMNNTWERFHHGNVAETSPGTRNSWDSGSIGFSVPVRMRLTF
jgi:hypothetical protein